jgi:hypothetical protein
MKPIWPACVPTLILALLTMSLPASAVAQYVWLDEKGGKHYSDVPPPTSIPNNRILKAPGAAHLATAKTAEVSATPQSDEEASITKATVKTPKTVAEKNADFIKRKTEQAEKEKKAADEAKRLADKAKSCERTREYQRVLDSGQRIAQTDKYGERAIMNDEQRAQELREAKQMLAECK